MDNFNPHTGSSFREHAGRPDPDQSKPPMIGLLAILVITAAVFLTAGVTLGWLVWGGDPQALLDAIAPTAAQAREQSWVNIAEGL